MGRGTLRDREGARKTVTEAGRGGGGEKGERVGRKEWNKAGTRGTAT